MPNRATTRCLLHSQALGCYYRATVSKSDASTDVDGSGNFERFRGRPHKGFYGGEIDSPGLLGAGVHPVRYVRTYRIGEWTKRGAAWLHRDRPLGDRDGQPADVPDLDDDHWMSVALLCFVSAPGMLQFVTVVWINPEPFWCIAPTRSSTLTRLPLRNQVAPCQPSERVDSTRATIETAVCMTGDSRPTLRSVAVELTRTSVE